MFIFLRPPKNDEDSSKFYDNVVGNDWKSKNKRNYLKGKK